MKFALLAILALGPCQGEVLRGVDLKLIADTTAIEPGTPFTAGLHIHHHEGYHTYWKNPGIVGVPTGIKWTLPKGFKVGPIQWPSPEIVDMAGHPAHGFHRDVLLMVRITPPSKINGTKLTLRADASWMACAKTCHPGTTSLSLTLPVGSATPSTSQPLFAQARKELPPSPTHWKINLLSAPDAPTIRLRLTSLSNPPSNLEAAYFFSGDGQVSSDRPQKLEDLGSGNYNLTMERSDYGPAQFSSLPGVLSAKPTLGAGHSRTASINPSYPEKNRKHIP